MCSNTYKYIIFAIFVSLLSNYAEASGPGESDSSVISRADSISESVGSITSVSEMTVIMPDSVQGDFIEEKTFTDVGNQSLLHLAAEDKEGKDTDPNRDWWHLLWKGKLQLNDTTVHYPKFVKFCVDVYNWADKTFNSYDPDYVVGTGKRWKARIVSDNWVDSYAVNFNNNMPIRIMSDFYCNVGAYLQYMAVSIGTTLDFTNIIGDKSANHKKIDFGFNCARFDIEMHYWENTGGSYIRQFGNYNNGHLFKLEYPGINLKLFDISGYYFFNNKKYSQGAAYNFSKFQKRSAGSFMIGFTYSNIDYNLQLSRIPYKLTPFLTIPMRDYHLHYYSYCITAGYGFNWVLNKHLLFNVTVTPEIGFTHCYEDSFESSSKLFATNFKAMASLTYNIKDYFICATGKAVGNWFRTGTSSFFSSIENAAVSVGVRF